jgi:hypothetical protein
VDGNSGKGLISRILTGTAGVHGLRESGALRRDRVRSILVDNTANGGMIVLWDIHKPE